MGQNISLSYFLSHIVNSIYTIFSNNRNKELQCNLGEDGLIQAINYENERKILCSVCHNSYNEIRNMDAHVVELNCGHQFCNVCADVFKSSMKCPVCRACITEILDLKYIENPLWE